MLDFLINNLIIKCNKIDIFLTSKKEILIRIHELIEDEKFNKLYDFLLSKLGQNIKIFKYKGIIKSIYVKDNSLNINFSLNYNLENYLELEIKNIFFKDKELNFSKVVKLIEKDKIIFIFEEPNDPILLLKYFTSSDLLNFKQEKYKILNLEITDKYWNSLSVVITTKK